MLAIAVQHDVDGEVDLRIATAAPDSGLVLLFEGTLLTSRRLVKLITVYLDPIASIRTLTEDVQFRVWGDHPREPEKVIIECLDLVEVEAA